MKTTSLLCLVAGALGTAVGCATVIGLQPADQPACTDPADQTVLGEHQGTFLTDVVACAVSNAGDLGAASACIEKGTDGGLSQPCVDCSAASGACAVAECGEQCVGSADAGACQGCMATKCDAALLACAGTPLYACTDATDEAALLVHMSNLEMDVKTCSLANGANQNAIASCIAKADDLTTPCAACYVQAYVCAATECSAQCVSGTASAGCTQCVDEFCGPAFALCSGIPTGDGGPGF